MEFELFIKSEMSLPRNVTSSQINKLREQYSTIATNAHRDLSRLVTCSRPVAMSKKRMH